tara:strand:- start:240 stop:662 length:423 start_codon:yes stop_codon:yes gene_type:complete
MFGKMFKNIPDEVLGVIYTYLHELKYCLDDIKIKGSQSRMNQITNLWLKNRKNNILHNGNYDNYFTTLRNNLDDPQHIISHLSKCKCCTRHMSNIPTTLNDQIYLNFINNYDYTQMNQDKHECNCTCRHECRFIHRVFSE